MPDVDIEIIQAPPDTGEHSYPMAKELQVEGTHVTKGDLLFSFGDEKLDSTWTVVYGFDWGGIYTDSLTRIQMPMFREWSDFVDDLDNGEIQVVPHREETSYYTDEETVRTLAQYRNYHDDGVEFVLVEYTRHPLETQSALEAVNVFDSAGELVDYIYRPDKISSTDEAEAIYDFLLESGVREKSLSSPEDIVSQDGLESYSKESS